MINTRKSQQAFPFREVKEGETLCGRWIRIIWFTCMVITSTANANEKPPFVEIPDYWTRLGPYGGGMVELAFAPSDPNIVYCLIDDKNYPLYRSSDGGRSWVPKQIEQQMEFAPTAMGVSPHDPNMILMSTLTVVYQTSDGGNSWRQVREGNFSRFLFDPADSLVVYAWLANQGGIYQSKDSGITWRKMTEFSPLIVDIDPYDRMRWVAVDYRTGRRGLYLSDDGGVTWSLQSFTGQDLSAVSFGKHRNVLYVVRRSSLWKSADNAANWSMVHDFGTTIKDLQVVTGSDEVLYAAASRDYRQDELRFAGVYRSTDSGSSWNRLTDGLGRLLHSKVRVDPYDPDHLLATDGFSGFHVTFDGGATWRMPGSDFRGQWLTAVAASPLIDGMFLVQARGGYQIIRTTDYGANWHYTNYQKDVYIQWPVKIEFSPFDPNRAYIAGNNGIFRSDDAGMNWMRFGPAGFVPYAEIVASPGEDELVLAAGGQGQIARTTDGGVSWKIPYDSADQHVQIKAIKFVPLHPQTVYALKENWGIQVVTLLKSTDEGASWRELSVLPTIYVWDLAVSATEPEILYACNGANPFRSTDSGLSWSKLEFEPMRGLFNCMTSTRHPSRLWTSGRYDVLFSPDYGESWRQIDLPVFSDKQLLEEAMPELGPDRFPNILFATKYDGVWVYPDDVPPQVLMGGSITGESDGREKRIWIYALVTHPSGVLEIASVKVLIDDLDTGLQLFDDGTHGDNTPHDGLFVLELTVDAQSTTENLQFKIVAEDKTGLISNPWPELTVH